MTQPQTGSLQTLIAWFKKPVEPIGSEDDEIREIILGRLARATCTARHNDEIFAAAPGIRAAFEVGKIQGSKIVIIDAVTTEAITDRGAYLPANTHYQFWMNPSSVADLGGRLRGLPRVSINQVFVGEVN